MRMAQNNLVPIAPRHPRERLPLPVTQILQSKPETNLQHGGLPIMTEEFEARIKAICFQLFPKFVGDNYSKIKIFCQW